MTIGSLSKQLQDNRQISQPKDLLVIVIPPKLNLGRHMVHLCIVSIAVLCVWILKDDCVVLSFLTGLELLIQSALTSSPAGPDGPTGPSSP